MCATTVASADVDGPLLDHQIRSNSCAKDSLFNLVILHFHRVFYFIFYCVSLCHGYFIVSAKGTNVAGPLSDDWFISLAGTTSVAFVHKLNFGACRSVEIRCPRVEAETKR